MTAQINFFMRKKNLSPDWLFFFSQGKQVFISSLIDMSKEILMTCETVAEAARLSDQLNAEVC